MVKVGTRFRQCGSVFYVADDEGDYIFDGAFMVPLSSSGEAANSEPLKEFIEEEKIE